MKEPDYVVKIMAILMTLNELEVANTCRQWKDANGASITIFCVPTALWYALSLFSSSL